ncbi:MAG TPA: hypothetical protein VM841_15295 [Actinomycetota bacterium]|nr:hypothetical protein [Actinomycetota bacterium]
MLRARHRGRRTAALLCLASLSIWLRPAAAAPSSDLRAIVRADADWLMQAVTPDGGIGTWIDRAWLVPYRSNFAAIGLARATAVTGDPRYAAAAWRWLEWYANHMDARGFVTDYQWAGGGWRSTGDMDSTDAYAATFLLAAHETLRATGDLTRLSGLRGALHRALDALDATATGEGLHFAKPTYPIKYLMDEAENYAGLNAAVALGAALQDAALASRARRDAERLKAAVPLFKHPVAGYHWALDAMNRPAAALNWNELYASAVAQAWAIAFGLVEGAEAASLFARFEAAQPRWDEPLATTQYPWGPGRVDYWPVVALAAKRAGDPARAAQAATRIRDAALSENRFWPYTTAEAGEMIMVMTDGITQPAPLVPIATVVLAPPPAADPSRGVGATLTERVSGRPISGATVRFHAIDAISGARGGLLCEATTNTAGLAECGGTAARIAAIRGGGFEATFGGSAIYAPGEARRSTLVIR